MNPSAQPTGNFPNGQQNHVQNAQGQTPGQQPQQQQGQQHLNAPPGVPAPAYSSQPTPAQQTPYVANGAVAGDETRHASVGLSSRDVHSATNAGSASAHVACGPMGPLGPISAHQECRPRSESAHDWYGLGHNGVGHAESWVRGRVECITCIPLTRTAPEACTRRSLPLGRTHQQHIRWNLTSIFRHAITFSLRRQARTKLLHSATRPCSSCSMRRLGMPSRRSLRKNCA